MRKVKYFIYKESEMDVVIMEMNGDKVEHILNYIPANRGFYNVAIKGEKLVRTATAEETLQYLQTRKDDQITAYVKVPSKMKSVAVADLRIA